jgi:malic enzyme
LQAFSWTQGKAIVASGSPFDPVTLADGKTYFASQANNMWTFPAIGLGASTCQVDKVMDHHISKYSQICGYLSYSKTTYKSVYMVRLSA